MSGTVRRRSLGARVWVLILVIVVLALLAACANEPSDSGIEGVVRIGPINPVEQPGVENTKPYAADLVVKGLPGEDEVAKTRSGEDGRFRIALAPGDYLLVPVNGDPLPVAQPQTVTVRQGEFTAVQVDYDSGIR